MRALHGDWSARLFSAVAFLLALAACAIVPGAIQGHRARGALDADLVVWEGQVQGGASDVAIEGMGALEGWMADASSLPFDLHRSLEGFADYQRGYLPRGFSEELFDPGALSCTEVCGAQGVVGMSFEGSASKVMGQISEQLERNGWFLADEADSFCRSFVKAEGSYRWVCASAAEVSGSVSVWVAYLRRGE